MIQELTVFSHSSFWKNQTQFT